MIGSRRREHAAIVSRELWDRVHAVLQVSPRVRANQARAQSPALLKGLIFGLDGRALSPTHTRKGGKQYRYYVYNFHSMDPLLRQQAWHFPHALDLAAMREAARHFHGKRDYAAFANHRRYEMESTVRTLRRCEVRAQGRLLTFIIEGDGFLYKMCRGIVGTIVQAGQGRLAAADLPRILESKDRSMAGMTAPAHGLILWKVFY